MINDHYAVKENLFDGLNYPMASIPILVIGYICDRTQGVALKTTLIGESFCHGRNPMLGQPSGIAIA